MGVTRMGGGLGSPRSAHGRAGLGLDKESSGSDSLLGAPKEEGLYFLFLFLRARGEASEQTFLKPDPEWTLEQRGLGLRLNRSKSRDKQALVGGALPKGHPWVQLERPCSRLSWGRAWGAAGGQGA